MNSSMLPTYLPAQPYGTNRLKEPPRIAVPPPNLEYTNGKPSFSLRALAPDGYGSDDYGNPIFLRALVDCGKISLEHRGLDWKYEQRRTAQKVLPFLLLGPGTTAQRVDFLRAAGITLLVAVRSAAAARTSSRLLDPTRSASILGIQSLTLDLDSPGDLINKLPRAIKAINDHLEQNCGSTQPRSANDIMGKVLIYCESGNERSATVVAAYLMVLYGIKAVEALQLVQSQRFCIAIDDAMKNMLQTFEGILQARRDVAENQTAFQQSPGMERSLIERKASKRNYDSSSDSNDEMQDSSCDGSSSEDRQRDGQAPFQDTTG